MNSVRVLTVKSAACQNIYPIYIYISIIYILSYEQCACFDSEKCCE